MPLERSPLDHLASLRLHADGLLFELARITPARLATRLSDDELLLHEHSDCVTLLLELAMPLRGGKRIVVRGTKRAAQADTVLIAALRRAHSILTFERGQPVLQTAPASPYERMILCLALLAPDIQSDILKGSQPAEFNLETFRKIAVPLTWSNQRAALEWG